MYLWQQLYGGDKAAEAKKEEAIKLGVMDVRIFDILHYMRGVGLP